MHIIQTPHKHKETNTLKTDTKHTDTHINTTKNKKVKKIK